MENTYEAPELEALGSLAELTQGLAGTCPDVGPLGVAS